MSEQEITTNDWTQVTDLTSGTIYLLQAQTGENDFGNAKPCDCMWLQQGSAPSPTDIGVIANTVKVDATTDVYVKVRSIPTIIISQETEGGSGNNAKSLSKSVSETKEETIMQPSLKKGVEEIIEEIKEETREEIKEEVEEETEKEIEE